MSFIKDKHYFEDLSPLIAYDETDWDTLASEGETIAKWIPELVAVFYDTLYESNGSKSIFHEGERPQLEKTLEDWVISLQSGRKDDTFWEHQWFIALLHVRRGVKNLFMLGMMNRVQQVVWDKCIETYDLGKAHQVYLAFHRISGAIAALIAESYGAVTEKSAQAALEKVGINATLLQRIKDAQIIKQIDEAQS